MRYVTWFFESVFPSLLYIVDIVFSFFSKPISEILTDDLGLTLPWIVDLLNLLDFTVMELALGSGLAFFLIYSLIKWITDIAA